MFDTNTFLTTTKLFWQYPAITEQTFYEQNKENDNYLGIPWATLIDKRNSIDFNYIVHLIKINQQPNVTYYTCCQHIIFHILVPIWKFLNITVVYISHKIISIDAIDGIELKPCPLYAVNVENFKLSNNVDSIKRDILYSFVGAYRPDYLTGIRLAIFNMKHPENTNIKNTGDWHYNKLVYHPSQNVNHDMNINQEHIDKTNSYNEILLRSRFTLAPSGTGPNSIRFWEALGAGSIPILLADTLELPEHKLWDDAILRVLEKNVGNIPKILEDITPEREHIMRENCLKLYREFKDNYKNMRREIIHYCCGSYYLGYIGGVARYDYQISLAFPKYRHFTGPQQKNDMLEYLKQCKHPLVITDNHLSCDIPNKYEILLVHHGCAMTTATRNPDWGEPWKSLCTNGQNKMLDYRDVKNTTIISISQSCTDDFTKWYGVKYLKFKRIPILHPSELDENKIKQTWNYNPIVLGNWNGIKKGERLISYLNQSISNFTFQQLRVGLDNRGIDNFNERKQDIYLNSDIFLQISNSEGNSYATLDALLCGIPVVASNVGLFYKDVPEDCFVKIEWERNGDVKYVKERLKYAWENKEEIGRKGREWYMKHCCLTDWIDKMKHLV